MRPKSPSRPTFTSLRAAGRRSIPPDSPFTASATRRSWASPPPPALGDLEGLALGSDLASTGEFACANDLFNRIQEMTRRTFLSNVFSVQSDCPHREKFGYGGDLVATADAFLANFDMQGFYAKVATDWADAALPDGMLTDTAPFVGIQYCGLAWAMAHPLIQDRLLRHYGDRRLVEEQYGATRRWLDLVTRANPDGMISQGLADHESLKPTPVPALVTPLYRETARLVSRLAGLLGRAETNPATGISPLLGAVYRERSLARRRTIRGPDPGRAGRCLGLDLVPERARPPPSRPSSPWSQRDRRDRA